MGDGHNGAVALDTVAAGGDRAREDDGVLRGRGSRRDGGAAGGAFRVWRAVAREPPGAGRLDMHIPVRGVVLGHLRFGGRQNTGPGVPDGNSQLVPASVSV